MEAGSEPEQRFEEYRKFLTNEAQRLAGYMAVYRTLQQRRDDRLEEMNIAPAFFSTVIDALFSVIILWTDKMFDERSKRGFVNFLTFCEHNHRIFTVKELQRRQCYPDDHWMLHDRADVSYQMIQDHRQKLQQLKCLPSIRTRRDKFHAHFDTEYFFDRKKISADAPLTYNDLQEIRDTMTEVINAYSASYDGQLFALESLNITDVDTLLNRLRWAPRN